MSLSTRLTAAFGRVGTEIKTLRNQVNTVEGYSKRWEQEILVQAGVRELGYGPALKGLYIPYNVKLVGIRYEFETPTTSGTTTGRIWLNNSSTLASSTNMSISALNLGQTINGLNINVDGGSRLSFETTAIGSGTIGEGLYMALWGEYR